MDEIPLIYEMANLIHKDLHEDLGVFVERLTLFPEGCFVLGDVGYAISHPYTKNAPPLNTLIHSIPEQATCLYIHDVAILEPFRGCGAASALVSHMNDLALKKGLREMALTSVYGTESFWRRQGFLEDSSVQCPSYGDSCFMTQLVQTSNDQVGGDGIETTCHRGCR